MNPELIKSIIKYKIHANTSLDIIYTFLNTCISGSIYNSVEGETIEEKVITLRNYLNDITPEPEVKSKLNLVIADDSSSLEYVDYLNKRYDVTVHKSADVKNVKDIDLILFTGGEDVNPQHYGEKLGKYTSINENRDSKEIDVYYRFKNKVPMLGICRGNQLLTVLNGGKLIQHVSGHGRDHNLILNNGLRYKITSSHHQMVYPFNLDKNAYELVAFSEYFQSGTYLNGNNEEIELSKDFLEPEIVFYKYTNSLCIQGHPEWSHCDTNTSKMCLNLIDKYLIKSKKEVKSELKTDSYFIKPSYSEKPYYDDNNEDDEAFDWKIMSNEEL